MGGLNRVINGSTGGGCKGKAGGEKGKKSGGENCRI